MVFVHGYGADGNDLLGLAQALAPVLPDTVFVAPDAPEPVAIAPTGRQWFGIPRFDGSSEADARAGLARARDDLNAFLDARLRDEAIAPSALAVVGFSQGAMVSLDAIPRRAVSIAAVVAISGALRDPTALVDAPSRPPFLVMHGDRDEVVPFAAMEVACEALAAQGFPTSRHVMRGSGHGISPDGLAAMTAFLKKSLDG